MGEKQIDRRTSSDDLDIFYGVPFTGLADEAARVAEGMIPLGRKYTRTEIEFLMAGAVLHPLRLDGQP